MKRKNVIIMGAAGRDFHNFNTFFRNNKEYNVVCFTAEQIPDIAGRKYPKELAGRLYPKGIPIYPEKDLSKLIKKYKIDLVNLAYSDLNYPNVMHKASIVNSSGANFVLLGPRDTMLKSNKKIIAVTAVRTGCGKSQTTRYVCKLLRRMKKKVVAIRHPMPYGDLRKQICQRFEKYSDLDKHKCTIEEREEYEPLINIGVIVYAGVDYGKILRKAEKEADVIVWDGGNNDFPFYKSNFHMVIADPLRPGHEKAYYPGEINVRMSDLVIVNKQKSASKKNVEKVKKTVKELNPNAIIADAHSKVTVSNGKIIKGKNVLVVEDGPTLTHGEMGYGAGTIAAQMNKAKIINAKKYALGSLKDVYKKYKHLKKVLPAMGYSDEQIKELERTINKAKCDAVVIGTPIDLRKLIKINKLAVRVKYELVELKGKTLEKEIKKRFK